MQLPEGKADLPEGQDGCNDAERAVEVARARSERKLGFRVRKALARMKGPALTETSCSDSERFWLRQGLLPSVIDRVLRQPADEVGRTRCTIQQAHLREHILALLQKPPGEMLLREHQLEDEEDVQVEIVDRIREPLKQRGDLEIFAGGLSSGKGCASAIDALEQRCREIPTKGGELGHGSDLELKLERGCRKIECA
ncbi:hypothetical protein [Lichenifustis flavocetrariae]|uniref:Uncharacterized protein n=1 Tax=Lichenifustis flavocetrariae TaxID=2949735 RepID=A0AA41Z278_9HYPH|nr:hypothetical protein [Lichenifustis flavocetrariae]MCW6512869.1 hypothetical protein [Lichenifustis flavocetrariae]